MSGLARKLTLFIIPFFLILFSAILGLYWLIFRGTSVGFISLNRNLSWRVDDEFSEARKALSGVSGGKLFVYYLSPTVVEKGTTVGVLQNFNPVYYANWEKFGGIDVLRISVTDEWEKIDPKLRDTALAVNLIVRSVVENYEGEADLGITVRNLAWTKERSFVGIEKR